MTRGLIVSRFHRLHGRGYVSGSRIRCSLFGSTGLSSGDTRSRVIHRRILSSIGFLIRRLPRGRERIIVVHCCRSLSFGRVTRVANIDVGATLKHVHCTLLGLHGVTLGGRLYLTI